MKIKKQYRISSVSRRTRFWLITSGLLAGVLLVFSFNRIMDYTSTDKYCMSCHIHPTSDQSWKLSTHYNNPSGAVTHCYECHLPPKG
ncbi:MAG: NapC/NirT family cytochrome c, partial [Bacteroidales bacterium]|nr:NapC/NirT family cytochrome c [Bacteroidales bacterium]